MKRSSYEKIELVCQGETSHCLRPFGLYSLQYPRASFNVISKPYSAQIQIPLRVVETITQKAFKIFAEF